jgi:hypothetical protein
MMPMQPFPQAAPPAPRPVKPAVLPQVPQPTAWQATQPLPVKARGVAAEPAPAKFVMPSPETLGVTAAAAAPMPQVDWQQIQARMARLGVLRYRKDALPTGGCQVTLLLPTADPTRGQPVQANGETEVAALLIALAQAEALPRR